MKAINQLKDHVGFLCCPCTCLQMGIGLQIKQQRLDRRSRDRSLTDRRGLQFEMETKLFLLFVTLCRLVDGKRFQNKLLLHYWGEEIYVSNKHYGTLSQDNNLHCHFTRVSEVVEQNSGREKNSSIFTVYACYRLARCCFLNFLYFSPLETLSIICTEFGYREH
jgi:hypothetical protein